MLRRLRISAAFALVALVALALPGPAVARLPPGFVGMVLSDPVFPGPSHGPAVDLGSQLDSMVGAGVETVRVVFNWSTAQPYQSFRDVPADQQSRFTDVGGVPTTFSPLDPIVALAAQRGLKLLPVVLYAPGWDAASHPDGTYANPASTGPYAAFLKALIERYGPQGSFWTTHSPKLPIRSWQVWNEPNISIFWADQPFQPGYVTLLRAAHDAIKSADPGATVVLAGMPNYSWSALRGMYRLGAKRLFDVVAIHPYTRTPAGVISILTKVRGVMNAAGDRRKGIIADEVSWPSSLGRTTHNQGFDFSTTETEQARNLAQLLPMLGRDRAKLGLVGFDYYTWAGVEDRGGYSFDFSGLFRLKAGRLTAKPAFYSFRRAALKLESCRGKGSVATVCRRRS